jgi:hypothetical protein
MAFQLRHAEEDDDVVFLVGITENSEVNCSSHLQKEDAKAKSNRRFSFGRGPEKPESHKSDKKEKKDTIREKKTIRSQSTLDAGPAIYSLSRKASVRKTACPKSLK